MNRLRELTELRADQLLFPEEWDYENAFAIWSDIQNFSEKSMCFWLGEVEQLDGLKPIPELCRLPYPVCWFEIGCTTEAKTWILGILTVQTDKGIRITSFRRMNGDWQMRFTADTDSYNSGKLFISPPREEIRDEVLITKQSIDMFLSALHCTNVKKEETAPSIKIQHKRQKRGKKPLFSYWTLSLLQEKSARLHNGGTHASPRVHLRRGHPRQYAPGKYTWVHPCKVGTGPGIVHKDYDGSRIYD